jgi:SAM-dependent methyltransferase
LETKALKDSYGDQFFGRVYQDVAWRSARVIVPLVLNLVPAERVVDVGCGLGIWLEVFKETGVKETLGIDGDWVNTSSLQIPEGRFLKLDLTKPFELDATFDLVVSLEVAEHLPADCAETFVDSLVKLGSVVLFSAAIPFQGGRNHQNEQWPDYWARHFRRKDYVAIDCIRRQIWQNDDVEWWYAQNTFIFVQETYLDRHAVLKKEFERTSESQLSLVHPKHYMQKRESHLRARSVALDPRNIPLREMILALPTAMKKAVINRLNRLKDYVGLPLCALCSFWTGLVA